MPATTPVESRPTSASWLGSLDLVQRWAERTTAGVAEPAFRRDPAFIARLLPLMETFSAYFAGEVRGLDRVPRGGGFLLVGNHSGGNLTPDTTVLLARWFRERGLDDPLTVLAHDAAFGLPGFGELCRRLGLVPARRGNAERALGEGHALLVYPGGARDAFRPYRERNRIELCGRTGFVQVALRAGVPVYPVVGHGGHETTIVVTRGDDLTRVFGLERVRVDVMPLLWQVPWGLSTPLIPGIPLPAKITVEIGEPLDWSHHGAAAADDPGVLAACHDQLRARMQAMLDALARERPRPLLSRFSS